MNANFYFHPASGEQAPAIDVDARGAGSSRWASLTIGEVEVCVFFLEPDEVRLFIEQLRARCDAALTEFAATTPASEKALAPAPIAPATANPDDEIPF